MTRTKTNASQVHAIGGGVLLTLGIAGWLLFLRPSLHAHEAYASLIRSLETNRGQLAAAQETEKSDRVAVEAAAASLAAHPLQLQSPAAVNERLQALGELAARCGFRVDALEAGRMEGFGQYGVLPVQTSGRGTYAAVKSLLAALAEKFPDMEVVSAEMSGRYSDGAAGQSVILKFRWHTTDAAVPGGPSAGAGQ